MAQFLKGAKLPLFLYLPLSDYNVITQCIREASASSSASSKLPVISLQKLSNTLLISDRLWYLLTRSNLSFKVLY
jgi:hypothetical protein